MVRENLGKTDFQSKREVRKFHFWSEKSKNFAKSQGILFLVEICVDKSKVRLLAAQQIYKTSFICSVKSQQILFAWTCRNLDTLKHCLVLYGEVDKFVFPSTVSLTEIHFEGVFFHFKYIRAYIYYLVSLNNAVPYIFISLQWFAKQHFLVGMWCSVASVVWVVTAW